MGLILTLHIILLSVSSMKTRMERLSLYHKKTHIINPHQQTDVHDTVCPGNKQQRQLGEKIRQLSTREQFITPHPIASRDKKKRSIYKMESLGPRERGREMRKSPPPQSIIRKRKFKGASLAGDWKLESPSRGRGEEGGDSSGVTARAGDGRGGRRQGGGV